jgi:acetolactate synthase small subunit
VPIINVALVKKQAEGHKSGDIQAAINNWAGVKNVDVKLSPFWVSKAPKKDGKITVILKEVKDTQNSSAP